MTLAQRRDLSEQNKVLFKILNFSFHTKLQAGGLDTELVPAMQRSGKQCNAVESNAMRGKAMNAVKCNVM